MSLPNTDLPTSILFCRLCQSLYRNPRTLPCLHSFCLECISHLAPRTNDRGQSLLDCPLCGQAAPLSSAGVAGLTSNEFLARMCQEYVGEVQKTLVSSRSMSPAGVHRRGPMSPATAGRAPGGHFQYSTGADISGSPGELRASFHRAMSPTPGLDPAFRGRQSSSGGSILQRSTGSSSSDYLSTSHLMTSPRHSRSSSSSTSASDAVLQTAQRLSMDSLPSRGVGVQRRLSSTPTDVVRTWECLQRKMNSLQSASLKATYSLESLNMIESNWHLRKQDLRRDVQRRSAQLQFFIKRQERLLLAALDSKKTDDSFMSAAERARSDMRANLKALMHETDVLKSVLDLATDSELMALSSLLLGSTICQTSVDMEVPELRLMVPDNLSLEDMVDRDFGCLTSTLITHSIFTPEEIQHILPEDSEEDDAFSRDVSTIDASSTTASIATSDNYDDVSYMDDSAEDEEEMVVEETFEIIDGKMQIVSKTSAPSSKKQSSAKRKQSSKEANRTEERDHSNRGRGTEVRRTVNSSTYPAKDASTAQSSSTKTGDQSTESDPNSGSVSPPNESQTTIDKFQNLRHSLQKKRRELLLNAPMFSSHGSPTVVHLMRGEKRVQSLDRTASLRDQTRRSYSPASAEQSMVPSVTAPVITTPTSPTNTTINNNGHDAVSSSIAMVRSDPGVTVETAKSIVSPTSPTERTSRPIRRAISAASDKASKMEYLRESWRKRKELLNKNETYFTVQDDKPQTGDNTEDVSSKTSASKQNGADTSTPPPASKSKLKHSLMSRISNLKQALKKNGKGEESVSEPKPDMKTKENVRSPTDKTSTAARSSAQEAAEKNVLKTIESILQKKNIPLSDLEPQAKSLTPAQPATSPTSAASKPSMLVKPCPRETPTTAPTTVTAPLEPLQEDEGKTSADPARKPGLRVTSPVRHDVSKEKMQRARANIRQKKERWRSLSLT